MTPATSTRSAPTGAYRRTVAAGTLSTAILIYRPVTPSITWLTAAPTFDEDDVWATLDPAIRRSSPALDSAGDHLSSVGVRVDLRSSPSAAWPAPCSRAPSRAGVITCAVDPPPAGLARKVHVTYC